jgi:hypothetical protein
MSAWEVGQTVIVIHANYGRGLPRVTDEQVARVGRKYFYIKAPGGETAFEIATGLERPNGTNYTSQAFTPEGYRAHHELGNARRRLNELTSRVWWINQLTTEQMNAISDVIEAGS